MPEHASSSALKSALRLKLIPSAAARAYLDRHHPLGGGLVFSFALGIFWNDRLEGVMTWGSPVVNTAVWAYGLRSSETLELRKFVLTDVPPRNSESRALAVACRLVQKQYPKLRLLLTYCEGDERASAYRGSGWIPQTGYRYLSTVTLSDGSTISVREANRRGGLKRVAVRQSQYVFRRKWVFVLDRTLTERVVPAKLPTERRNQRACEEVGGRSADGGTPDFHPEEAVRV